jgi:hypothetical protein
VNHEYVRAIIFDAVQEDVYQNLGSVMVIQIVLMVKTNLQHVINRNFIHVIQLISDVKIISVSRDDGVVIMIMIVVMDLMR